MIKSKILSNIRNGNDDELGKLYVRYKEEFIRFAIKNFKVNDEIAKDIFTDMLIEFRNNIVREKLTHIDSSVKTYLFQIGHNMLVKHVKKLPDEDIDNYSDKLTDEDEGLNNTDEQNEILLQLIKNHLPQRCYKLLKLYYYDHRSYKRIQTWLNYSSVESVISQKPKCMNQLKRIIKLVEVQYKLFN